MKKIKLVDYKIKEIYPKIFAVEVKDSYQRAMLFLRFQEYYESAFPEFRGKFFDIFEYMERYRTGDRGSSNPGLFTYPKDWSGYNVPGEMVQTCLEHVLDIRNGILPTPYDFIMRDILNQIKVHLNPNESYYLLGVDDLKSSITDHEVCHGLFHVDKKYKRGVLKLLEKVDSKIYNRLKNILLTMGYCEEVIPDEIQAYLSTGITSSMKFVPGIEKEEKRFKNHFSKYKK